MGFFRKRSKTLLAQIVFTALAFVAMGLFSYFFMSSTVRDNLVRNADNVLDATQETIESTRAEFESAFEVFFADMEERLLRGDGTDALRQYIETVSSFTFLDGKTTSGIRNFFGYFEHLPGGAAYIGGGTAAPLTEGILSDREWYRMAVEENGGIVETMPFITDDDKTVYAYAKAILDEKGQRLGVVGLTVNIDLLGQSIVETAINQGGYGMLINQEGGVLFHQNRAFRGGNIYANSIPMSQFASELTAGQLVYEREMVAYTGERVVAFFRQLSNGWLIGLLTPRSLYYQSISEMGVVLLLLYTVLALILIGILIRLDAARMKSDEDSRQKSMFLANMSHEIRTPINAIVGMTAIGKAAGASERKDYCFSKIDDASRHLLGVINDILEISKIEANKMILSPADFNFEKMLQQVVNVINFRLDEKNQKLSISIDKNIPRILYADDQRLSQVVTNLLSNAVKFTPEEGTIRLSASLLSEENGVYTLRIDVSDTGIGLSKEQQANLFQSFQQAESSTTRRFGGTGLGLAISKSIVTLMEGEIWVESELGHGSKFSFTAKVRHGDDTKYGFTYKSFNWDNIRILTVDDDQDILQYFQEVVKGFGATCEVAENAKEALHLVDASGAYNIYFIDLRMPGVDGIALTKEIRAREKENGNAIVIMISSADLSKVEDQARRAGVNKFLLKPLFPSAIVDAISECIGIVNERTEETPVDMNGLFEDRRILFAEDLDINREIVLALLEPMGLKIDCAENGAEAVAMFESAPMKYDLIFMDVQMPEMDGYEATRTIRRLDNERAKGIPIIAMTANVFKEDVEKCLQAGMNGHLGKPLSIEDMISVLMKFLGKKESP